MTRAAILVAALASASCAQAVQHPVPTLAAVGAVLGFGTCEMNGVTTGTCGIVGASGALLLGGVTALVYLLTDQPTPQMEGEEVPAEERIRVRHHAPILLPPSADDGSAAGSGSGSATGSGSAVDAGIAPTAAP